MLLLPLLRVIHISFDRSFPSMLNKFTGHTSSGDGENTAIRRCVRPAHDRYEQRHADSPVFFDFFPCKTLELRFPRKWKQQRQNPSNAIDVEENVFNVLNWNRISLELWHEWPFWAAVMFTFLAHTQPSDLTCIRTEMMVLGKCVQCSCSGLAFSCWNAARMGTSRMIRKHIRTRNTYLYGFGYGTWWWRTCVW